MKLRIWYIVISDLRNDKQIAAALPHISNKKAKWIKILNNKTKYRKFCDFS